MSVFYKWLFVIHAIHHQRVPSPLHNKLCQHREIARLLFFLPFCKIYERHALHQHRKAEVEQVLTLSVNLCLVAVVPDGAQQQWECSPH